MARKNQNKEKLLNAGMALVCERGIEATSISEITSSVDLPKGSFYNYFRSKDEFVLELVNLYKKIILSYDHKDLDLKKRLEKIYEQHIAFFVGSNFKNECLTNVMCHEVNAQNDTFRKVTKNIVYNKKLLMFDIYEMLGKEHRLKTHLDTEDFIDLIDSGLRGVMIRAKIMKNNKPFEVFMKFLFNNLIKDA
ncbi:TetR/AcrR family transcriptional regulator [Aureivirga sp. CE67]|uniref:TetR/AcrR family transcriptional regulator n=1 Tax=Aureivirga sp. CE67 TaxID=1788983 RepID=UPI0018C9E890|nr:TetR/AcrR family transcriptional regulator [Aureivirga sp. CE67]